MKKILLIEDEIILGESLVDVLEVKGYDVKWVKSVQEFHEVIDEVKVDVICSDFHLPDGTLVDIWQRLQQCEKSHEIPVMVMSATASERDRGFIEQNIQHVLNKPFLMSDLYAKLDTLLYD